MVKIPPGYAGDIRDEDPVPGLADPLGEEMAAHSNILAWRIHGQRSLVGCSSQDHKESDTTEVTQQALFISKIISISFCGDTVSW